MALALLILGLVLIVGLIVFHEWGHFIAAKRNGVIVESFGIFFPPKIFKKKTKEGWEFSVGAIPLGGYVTLKGENDEDLEPGSFRAASLWSRSKIIVAGVLMNLLAAVILLTILALMGMPKLLPNQFTVPSDTKVVSQKVFIGQIEAGSPAQKAGLKDFDQITYMGAVGKPLIRVDNSNTLPNITKSLAGKDVTIDYTRQGKAGTTTTVLLSKEEVQASDNLYNKQVSEGNTNPTQPKAYLGISPSQYTLQRSTWSAPITAVGLTIQGTILTFEGIGHALGGLVSLVSGAVTGNNVARSNGQYNATSELTGPIGIYNILKDFAQLGIEFVIFIIAVISLSLAVFNILPIPALDGGRLWMMLFTAAIKKPLSVKTEEIINVAGFIFIICLAILITIVDVKRF
ncbi:MAG TPA: M50 family metallopeptidase [Candidatus Sulfotelmatobacter sp.]|nr:M50 family metallopeptidase [Candidatus Sulfotelmatobacter sp.]